MNLSDFLSDGHLISIQEGEILPVELNEAVRSVLQRFPEVDASELDTDIDDLLGLLEDCRKKGDWTGIKWRHAASAARATFIPPRSLHPKWDRLRQLLVRTLDHDHKRSFAKASFSAYLEGFHPDKVLTQQLARSLGHSWPDTLPHIKRLVDRFSLFEVSGLDGRVAKFMANEDQPYRVLKDLGISTPHMNGLFQLAYRRFVARQRKAIARQNTTAIQRVLEWVHPDTDTALREGQAAAINTLLEPWAGTPPRAEVQERIQSELVEAYGDPRLSTAEWGRASKEALTVMRGWLTGASLEQFLEIVSAVEGSHMWEPRRDFWQGIYKNGLIEEAWVILSPQAARLARDRARRSDDKEYLSHARVRDAGSEVRCYLVLRCGEGVVIEGSHNFSVRFYKKSNGSCPSLYEDSYSKHDFNRDRANAWISHVGAWQARVQSEILKLRRG
ncbi:MAG: hypothetical protein HOK97_23850 [Deltaproteobacteria bacterium]|nr:hypothetical protein [Deltaproteobacteria bacterium]